MKSISIKSIFVKIIVVLILLIIFESSVCFAKSAKVDEILASPKEWQADISLSYTTHELKK